MHGLPPTDYGKIFNWSKASEDYAIYRPGPPISYYQTLQAFGIGLAGQKILDLGTGTGVLARQFAKQGAVVSGIDVAEGQIKEAKRLTHEKNLNVDFRVCPAEQTPFENNFFDIITANLCWLYFDLEKTTREIRRILKSKGYLLTSHNCWLPRVSNILQASEALILKLNPTWGTANYSGEIPTVPEWSTEDFRVAAMFYYDEEIPFTRETFHGRMRASRAIGASLSPDEVRSFDVEHKKLLEQIAPEEFTIPHRIDCHIFQFK